MLKPNKRVLSAAETFSSLLSGETVPSLYDIEEENIHPGVRHTVFKARPKTLKSSALASDDVVETYSPVTMPTTGYDVDWLTDALLNKRGVVAAIPEVAGHTGKIIAFDQDAACGHERYWTSAIKEAGDVFNKTKTAALHSDNRSVFEAITLQYGVPRFLPEGDAFGMEPADMDSLIDAGIKVEVRVDAYVSRKESVTVLNKDKQVSACAKELAVLLDMATRGVAPCVLAAFYTQTDAADKKRSVGLDLYRRPNARVSEERRVSKPPSSVSAMVVVSQLSTFSLADLMGEIKSAPVPARKEQLVKVMLDVCGGVFSKVMDMCRVHEGRGMIKLNMTPDSVVFCPRLVASDNSWSLKGTGYQPISNSHLDGLPMLSDFNSVFSTRVEGGSYSFETSYSMHCMLLVAFTRAQYGPSVSSILWKHLLEDGDPSGFVAATRAMQSRSTNASAFLAWTAANTDMHHPPELHKALGDAVSDMDKLVRSGVVSKDGNIAAMQDVPMFTKIVGVVTGSCAVDTFIFQRQEDDVEDVSEAYHIRALEHVKAGRLSRVVSKPQSCDDKAL
jgi:hypothetical protein